MVGVRIRADGLMLRKLGVILSFLLCIQCLPSHAYGETDSLANDRYSLYYYQDRIDLQEDYLDNALQMARIRRVLSASPRIDSIAIYAYASPEGNPRGNELLAKKRAEVARDFILANLPNDSVLLPQNIILHPMGENWDGLYKELDANYHQPNRDRVMKIMRADIPTETKKWRLRQLDNGVTYSWIIKHHMPPLRLATWVCVYVKIPEFVADSVRTQASLQLFSLEPIDSLESPYKVEPESPRSFKWAVKTNMLYDVALVPNLGVEFHLGRNFSLHANWHYAWWNTKSWFWRTYGGEVALRMWLGKQARKKFLSGHHIGLYGQLLTYDFLVGKTGYMSADPHETLFDRPQYAFGLEYGYSLPITKCLNIDFGIGVGYMKGVYNEYRHIDDCYVWQQRVNRKFIGPTKAEISLVWRLDWNTTKKGGRR